MKTVPVNKIAASAKPLLAPQTKTTIQIKNAFKELARLFAAIPEIGKFKAIRTKKAIEPIATEAILSDEIIDFDIYDKEEKI